MEFALSLTDIRTFQGIAMIVAASLAIVMLLIKVPHTEHASRLTKAKSIVALSYMFCAFIFGYTLSHQDSGNYEMFSALTMLINVAFATATLSYSLTNLLYRRYMDSNRLIVSLFAIFITSIGLIEVFFNGERNLFNTALIAGIVLFVSMCIYYIIIFDKWYKHSIAMLEKYYDEDEEHKLKWVKFCFILAMLTEMFVIVYLIFLRGFMFIYIGFYILFLLYFASNFISFIGSHKLLLDAFGHWSTKSVIKSGKTGPSSRSRKRKKEPDQEEAFEKVKTALDAWVARKGYRECDKSRDETAAEIGVSKELLNQYFARKIGKDFRTWRTELRVSDAQKLLLEDRKMSSNIIGELVGFSDRSNFHRQFTRITGCSPKVWRDSGGENAG